jgi:hypothetical protein
MLIISVRSGRRKDKWQMHIYTYLLFDRSILNHHHLSQHGGHWPFHVADCCPSFQERQLLLLLLLQQLLLCVGV